METRVSSQGEQRVETFVKNVPGPQETWQRLVEQHPNDAVLSDTNGSTLSRKEVEARANKVNGYLRKRGIGKEDIVVICLNRSVNPVIAALGVWKAGAAFCLLEADYAPERIARIMEEPRARLKISEENWQEIMAAEPSAELASPSDHDACAVVFTSGTTGVPKGVLHEYGQAKLAIVSETQEDGSIRQSRKTRWALGAPLNFVASLKTLVHFIYSGGHLYILDFETVKNPRKLDSFFLRNRINETFLSPSHLRSKKGELGPFMKTVYCGASPAENVSLNHGTLINNYSMTETIFTICDYIVDKPCENSPIGKPAFDLGIRLLGEDGQPVAEGEVGEIAFPNPFFRGYLNTPQENAAIFADGLFRTRDMACLQDGLYLMRGRNDDMVKINGNRVEPLEIEKTFTRITGLDCVVRCFAEGDDEGTVVLYYVPDGANALDVRQVCNRLEDELPYYMVPGCFAPIEALPITPLGKVDRKVLKKPHVKRLAYRAPEGELELKIATAVASTLGLQRIGRDEDLFELGGTSMDIMEVLAALDLPGMTADMFFRGRTVADVARLYEEELGEGGAATMTEEEMELEGRKRTYALRDSAFILYMLQATTPELTDTVNLAQAFKLSRLISLEKMRDAINEYTSVSSTFKTVLEADGQGGARYKYAPELYKPVQVERMSERELKQLAQDFVQPFRLTEELPWRVRLVKTPRGKYLFFDIHHVLTDGEGFKLMAADILNLYQGKEARPSNFFAWLYREELLYNSSYFQECKTRLHNRFDNVDWQAQPDDPTGEIGFRSVEYDTGITLESLNTFLKANKRTRVELFSGALVLSMRETTGSDDIAIGIVYANRALVENVAGVRVRTLTCGFDLRDMPSGAVEYLDMVSAEVHEGIATACYCYRYRAENADIYPIIDDLEDLEELPPLLQRYATPVDLGRDMSDNVDNNEEPSFCALTLNYLNKGGKLLIRVKRDVHWMSDAARDAFAAKNIAALHRLMRGEELAPNDTIAGNSVGTLS